MAVPRQSVKQRLRRELALFLGLLFSGLVLLPIAIYLVGDAVFGDYGGDGFGGFFGALSGRIRNAEAVSWFLVLSPYLAWQLMRLTLLGWRLAGRLPGGDRTTQP